LEKAWENTRLCDLMLVLGSSCRIKPAAQMPKEVGLKKRGNLVVCNLQSTPVDEYATLRIGCHIDLLFGILMQLLNLEIPNFIVHRIIKIDYLKDWSNDNEDSEVNIKIDGVDSEGVTASYLKSMVVLIGKKKRILTHEPFDFNIKRKDLESSNVKCNLRFMENYNEPVKTIELISPKSEDDCHTLLELKYDPDEEKWLD